MAEQERDGVQVAAHDVVVGVDAPQLERPRPHGGLDVRRRRVGIEGEQRRQPVDDRCQRVRLAVRGARRADDDRLVLERLDDLVGQTGLAGARLTDDRDDATAAVADELHGGLEQGPLVHAADERDVAADRPAAGRRRPRDEPRLLGRSRPRMWVSANGSQRIDAEHSAEVAEPISTPPVGASACRRAAVLTTSPIAV